MKNDAMAWYRFDIADGAVLGGDFHKLCREFQHAFIAAGAPAKMALFASRGLFPEDRQLYMSPASTTHAEAVMRVFGGTPCDPPSPAEVTMVFGVPGAARKLLPTPKQNVSEREKTSPQPVVATQPAPVSPSG